MNNLLQKIIEKKELRSINKDMLEKIVNEEIRRNQKLYKKIEEKNFNEKSKEFKEFVKIIRKRLREIYGVFFKKTLLEPKKNRFLEELKTAISEKNKNEENKIIEKIMDSHVSTKERKEHYEEVYKRIFEITKTPKKILDLGCGYNPFSYSKLGCKPEYDCSDISEENMNFIKEYFEQKKIKGETFSADLTNEESLKLILKKSETANVVFLFKLLDSLEATNRGISKDLLKNIKSNHIVVSFPTKSISGKEKISSKRNWFKKIIEPYSSENFEVGDEEYIILNKRIL
jgi:16S rRNA (guanine(1405)-N(7))-methyltransferase